MAFNLPRTAQGREKAKKVVGGREEILIGIGLAPKQGGKKLSRSTTLGKKKTSHRDPGKKNQRAGENSF